MNNVIKAFVIGSIAVLFAGTIFVFSEHTYAAKNSKPSQAIITRENTAQIDKEKQAEELKQKQENELKQKQAQELKEKQEKIEKEKQDKLNKEKQKKILSDDTKTQMNSILKVSPERGNLDVKYTMLTVTQKTNVYESAIDTSPKVGSVGVTERVMFVSMDGGFVKIKYCNNIEIKEGYVPIDSVEQAPVIPNNFNNLIVPDNVTKVKYGTSGQGRGLYYYKIGNGSKHLLLNFAIHGYEDSWMQDGYTLTQIGEYVIKNLSERQSDDGLNGWTVYVIPSANPDGLVDGYTNNGPGRCEVAQGVDINRDFSGPGYVPIDTARNKTYSADSAPETRALQNLVLKLINKDPDLVVIDTHGWLDCTLGNQGVSQYFDNAFGLTNKVINVYDGGYFAGYAKMNGAREALVELPNPADPAGAASKEYNQKMLDAVNGIINNYTF